jgi:hypothetical protein
MRELVAGWDKGCFNVSRGKINEVMEIKRFLSK